MAFCYYLDSNLTADEFSDLLKQVIKAWPTVTRFLEFPEKIKFENDTVGEGRFTPTNSSFSIKFKNSVEVPDQELIGVFFDMLYHVVGRHFMRIDRDLSAYSMGFGESFPNKEEETITDVAENYLRARGYKWSDELENWVKLDSSANS